MNLDPNIPKMLIDTHKNNTSLWESSEDDFNTIERGIEQSFSLLKSMEFSPKGINIAIWSLMAYAMMVTILGVLIFYFVCSPGSLMACKACSCCCKAATIVSRDDLNA